MAWLIVLGVISLPAIEIALFVKSAQIIGVLPTALIAIAAGMTGIALLRSQGLGVLWRARAQLARGEIPMGEMFDAICLSLAALMFLLPGFLTDMVGILLLLPPVRAGLRLLIARRLVRTGASRQNMGRQEMGRTIEVEYHVVGGRRDDGGGGEVR